MKSSWMRSAWTCSVSSLSKRSTSSERSASARRTSILGGSSCRPPDLERMHLLRQLEDLPGEAEQFLVLLVFVLHGRPLLIGHDLSLHVRAVLADHHERGEEDGLERD